MLVLDQLRKDDPRLQALAVTVLTGLVILLAGLWYVQIVSAQRYQASAQNQTFRTVRLPAIRGKILERNGLMVAENRPSYNLDLYIEELRPQFDQAFTLARAGRKLSRTQRAELRDRVRYAVVSNAVQQAARILQTPITLTEQEFRRHHDRWPYRPLVVLANLGPQQVARLLEQAPACPGLELEIQPLRFYPHGPVVAHLLGYLTRDDLALEDEEGGCNYSLPSYQGAVGLEYASDRELSGRAGVKLVTVNSLSYPEAVPGAERGERSGEVVTVNSLSYREAEIIWAPSEPGQNVVLALDLAVQKAAAAALRSAGANVCGAIVVLDPRNGDVLALASSPAYDPNEFVTPVGEARWQQLNDPKLKPMFNRATQGAYPPGSAYKIITTLACLESGALNSGNLQAPFYNPGFYQLGRRTIHDTAEPGYYDFHRAFKRSSNTYFIHFGLKAGRERLLELGRCCGLGEAMGLPTRQEVSGWVPKPEEVRRLWNDGNTANVCIGQEITVTPLQMAVLTAAIANGGQVYYPRLVLRVEPPEPGLEETQTNYCAPQLRALLPVRAASLEILRAAMLADVEESDGTGHSACVPGMSICGKTGTAQVTRGHSVVNHIAWFASFAPYDEPRYVVVVMVESGGSGGRTCAPLARQVYEAIQSRSKANPSTSTTLGRDA
jgi:penicillin-binding protein 2